MMKISNKGRRYRALRIGGLAFCLLAVAGQGIAAEPKAERPAGGTFSLGLVSEANRVAIEGHFAELAIYVARKLSALSAVQGRVVVAATPLELSKLLKQRKVDYYFESAYATYIINNVHGAGRALLRRWKGGVAEYRSLIFSHRAGKIRRLADLRGRTIAFEDPGSTSGYLLPKFFLLRNGFKLVEKKARDHIPEPNAVTQYLFARSQPKLLELVLAQPDYAGAFSDQDYKKLDEKTKSVLTVVAQTERLPRHLVSVRADLAPQQIRRLEEVLLAMDSEEEARRILYSTDQTTKFDRLPGGEEAMRRRLLDTFVVPQR